VAGELGCQQGLQQLMAHADSCKGALHLLPFLLLLLLLQMLLDIPGFLFLS
jgi:hypothetical protein